MAIIANILSVTANPPATFTIASATAIIPKIDDKAFAATELAANPAAVAVSAPRTVIPDSAFIPDISGVCKRLGTFLMSRYPTTVATAKTPSKISWK